MVEQNAPAVPKTSSDVLALLRRHYLPEGRPAGGLFAPEIQSPDGRRRADLLWIPTSMAGRRADNIIGHEIKVSRSDVIAELNDPTKADSWAQFCTRWWLVIPDPALIDGLPVPEMWGVMGPPSGRRTRSMTIVRDAPKLTPVGDMTEALTRITAFVVGRVETKVSEAQRQIEWRDRTIERLTSQMEDMRLSGEFGRLSPHASRLQAILSAVQKRTREVGWWVREPDDAAVIDALVDYAVMNTLCRNARRSLERLVADVESPMAEVRKHLGAAQETANQLPLGLGA
jgi:hypothetical protein